MKTNLCTAGGNELMWFVLDFPLFLFLLPHYKYVFDEVLSRQTYVYQIMRKEKSKWDNELHLSVIQIISLDLDVI